MGCDIHVAFERRSGPDAPWVFQESERNDSAFGYSSWRVARDYFLFGVLVKGHHRAPNIDAGKYPERGFPRDVTAESIKDYEADGGGHTQSYLTLEELLSIDWFQSVKRKFVLNGPAMLDMMYGYDARWYGRFREPTYYHNHRGATLVSKEALDAMIRAFVKDKVPNADDTELKNAVTLGLSDTCAEVEIDLKLWQVTEDFYTWTISYMTSLMKGASASDVRMVFWFDN